METTSKQYSIIFGCHGMAACLQRPERPKTTVKDVQPGLTIRPDGVCFCTTCIAAHRLAVNRHKPYYHTLYDHSIIRSSNLRHARQSLLVASTKPTSVVSNSYSPMPARMVAAFKSQWLALRKFAYLFFGT